jgi:hypothetical protein
MRAWAAGAEVCNSSCLRVASAFFLTCEPFLRALEEAAPRPGYTTHILHDPDVIASSGGNFSSRVVDQKLAVTELRSAAEVAELERQATAAAAAAATAAAAASQAQAARTTGLRVAGFPDDGKSSRSAPPSDDRTNELMVAEILRTTVVPVAEVCRRRLASPTAVAAPASLEIDERDGSPFQKSNMGAAGNGYGDN